MRIASQTDASPVVERKSTNAPEEIDRAFQDALSILDRRISLFLCLPLSSLNQLRILNPLFHGKLCGCDIQHVNGASQSTVSRHLSYLKKAGLVLDRREGYRFFYRLVPSQDREISKLFAYLLESFAKDKQLKTDMKKLREAIKDGSCTVSEWKPFSGYSSPQIKLEGAVSR
jgi:ArsR family transcriptional regulator